MRIVRVATLKDRIAWTLIACGLLSPGKVGLDAARAAVYQRQYQRALREALGLAYTPRFELWFLHADHRIELA